jgi:hypothetical protein
MAEMTEFTDGGDIFYGLGFWAGEDGFLVLEE